MSIGVVFGRVAARKLCEYLCANAFATASWQGAKQQCQMYDIGPDCAGNRQQATV